VHYGQTCNVKSKRFWNGLGTPLGARSHPGRGAIREDPFPSAEIRDAPFD
jgi:hypothetical protein